MKALHHACGDRANRFALQRSGSGSAFSTAKQRTDEVSLEGDAGGE
jgi:hypothetical protein